MYYLTIVNLGREKCIDKNHDDIYENDQSYSFLPDLYFERKKMVKKIVINSTELPGRPFHAIVYSN